ncbi:MAG TPA: glutathionylspermidine synthase family protein [Stellaceae bacterium]|jgi:glutathionylspermidine synthase|nr:glutathionylspermidine synthase family protein [Stellaceae bacterium]
MRRETLSARPDWPAKVEALGLDFHTNNAEPYWWERACYAFSAAEIDVIEEATETLHGLCLKAVDRLVTAGDLDRLDIPAEYWPWITESWRRSDPDVYGRFDLAYDGMSPPKLLEYNADTPTALIEAAVVQWYWLEEVKPGRDQFNSLHEKLIDRWKELRDRAARGGHAARLHLTGVFNELEDRRTVEYMQDVANQAGWATTLLDVSEIGWNGGAFTDLTEAEIGFLFKLYPWEWMLREEFGPHLLTDLVGVVEPPWKMILSNKAILPVLWEMFPGHPNLLPASRERSVISGPCVEKPIYGREGKDVRLLGAGDRPSGHRDRVYQAVAPLPVFDGWHALIGSWIVGGKAAGMGLREDRTPITRNTSRFVPHYFV